MEAVVGAADHTGFIFTNAAKYLADLHAIGTVGHGGRSLWRMLGHEEDAGSA
jgi:hypothetical protein